MLPLRPLFAGGATNSIGSTHRSTFAWLLCAPAVTVIGNWTGAVMLVGVRAGIGGEGSDARCASRKLQVDLIQAGNGVLNPSGVRDRGGLAADGGGGNVGSGDAWRHAGAVDQGALNDGSINHD